MRRLKYIFMLSVVPFLSFIFCKPSEQTLTLINESKDIFGILPDVMPDGENDNPDLIALGKKLYLDKRLSKDDTISCNSCHNIENGGNGTDNAPTSTGINDQKGGRNAPTVLNAGFHFAQFWDGRAPNLKEQAKGPILNPIEMGMPNEDAVIVKIKGIEEYIEMFNKAFPGQKDAITYDNLAHAIAAFERTLVDKSRLDDFIGGKARALSSDEQAGLRTFIDTGCVTCHNGAVIGGNSYMKIGLINPFETKDLGRFEITKKEEDKFVFKVPSLRNISLTHPYFHDGSVQTLEEAVKLMGHHQLGKNLTDDEINKIVTFLKVL